MISIIIPTYNERENIVKIVQEIKLILAKSRIKFEIIIVDDNSPDGTGKKVKSIADNNIELLIRKNNRGLASAILYGIKKSKGEIIIGMDTDFNHPPETIVRLIDEFKNHDLIVASRFIKGGGMEDKTI